MTTVLENYFSILFEHETDCALRPQDETECIPAAELT